MHKLILTFLLLPLAILFSCVSPAAQPTTTENVRIVTSVYGMTKPLISGWDFGESSLLTLDETSIAILGVQLSTLGTDVYYSLLGSDTRKFLENASIGMTDNNGNSYEPGKIILLGKIDSIELGILHFGTRQPGATELFLAVSKSFNPEESHQINLAKFDGPISEDRLDLTYVFRRENGVVQGDYRTELFLWAKSDVTIGNTALISTPAVTPTPIQDTRKPWIESNPDVEVLDEYYFLVQNNSLNKSEYLRIQLLMDGNVISSHNGILSFSEVIDGVAPYGTSIPYP